MTHRRIARFLMVVVVVGSAMPIAVMGQSGTTKVSPKKVTATKGWTAPLTQDGQPDLQGIWLNNRATPLERPDTLAGRRLLTDSEVAELKLRAARSSREANQTSPLAIICSWQL